MSQEAGSQGGGKQLAWPSIVELGSRTVWSRGVWSGVKAERNCGAWGREAGSRWKGGVKR